MISIAKKALVLLPLAASPFSPPRTHSVRLENNRFAPPIIRAAPGDTLRFVNGNGGPHNVEFLRDSMPEPARKPFEKSMPALPVKGGNKLGPTASPLLIVTDETYEMVVPDVPAGRYAFLCSPHYAQMRGALVVER